MIRGVLLDSGHTLVRPLGGTWWPTLPFRSIAPELGIDPDAEGMLEAHQSALAYLDENHALQTLEEEEQQFGTFYRLLFETLEIGPDAALADRLAHETVYEQQLEMYDDSMEVVHEMRAADLRVGIVSDAWPSLDWRYRMLGVREHFDPFVISAQVGTTKPNPRIFRIALERIGLPAEQVFFVDDWPDCVQGAVRVGMHGAVIERDEKRPAPGLEYAPDMRSIWQLIRRS